MGFAGFFAICFGIVLTILAANGRLQNVIAAAFGQSAPGATPTGGWANDAGQAGPGSAGGWGGLSNLFGGWLQNIGQGGGGGSSSGGGGSGGGGDSGGGSGNFGGNARPIGSGPGLSYLARRSSRIYYGE